MLKLSVTSVMTNPQVYLHMIYMNMIQHLSGPNRKIPNYKCTKKKKKCKGRSYSLFF